MYYIFLIPLLLVGYKTNLKFKIMIKAILLLCRIILLKCMAYFDPRVVKLGKNKYEINYVLSNKLYKFQTNIQRGPSIVLQVIDGEYNDVTKLVKPYFGPNKDFHNIKYTPESLKFNELIFQLTTGDELQFKKSQTIELP